MPARTAPVRLNWELSAEVPERNSVVHTAVHNGNRIVRVRTTGWNDSFMVFAGIEGKRTKTNHLGTAASIGQARKIAERTSA